VNVQNGRSLTRSEHRRHDRLLVTRFAMGDAYPSERDEAGSLVEKCGECAALAADVKVIATSMSRLPVAPRTRDFMITAEQAERLRGGRVSRWLRSLGTPGWAMLRPVAGVALSIGLVMAVVGAGIPGMQPAFQMSEDVTTQAGAPSNQVPPAATPESGPAGPVMAPGSERDNGLGHEIAEGSAEPMTSHVDSAYVEPSPETRTSASGDDQAPVARVDTTRDVLVYGGLAIAMLSFALLALAMAARRYFADPLLR